MVKYTSKYLERFSVGRISSVLLSQDKHQSRGPRETYPSQVILAINRDHVTCSGLPQLLEGGGSTSCRHDGGSSIGHVGAQVYELASSLSFFQSEFICIHISVHLHILIFLIHP